MLLGQFIFAQHADRCGVMHHLQVQIQQDPTVQVRMQQIEMQTQQFVAQYNHNNNRTVITIPVVVHVVYGNASQNISDAFIQAQIAQLNLDYARLNTDASNTPSAFQGVAVNTGIQFCLASRDPNGNTTTGITRTSTNVSSWTDDDAVKHASSGGADAWPAASYLNIWACNLGSGLLGYAQFPGGAAATDGVVVLYSSVGSMANPTNATPYNMGRTATHEVGHWLNLYHIWGDDNGSCNGSDNVTDTPNQSDSNFGCPNFPHTDNCTASSPGVMFMNYMDYVDDNCMNMFTSGQSARMNAIFATGGARHSILASTGCQSLTSPPVANFSADVTTTCTGAVQFTDLSSNAPTSWAWNFGDGTTSTSQNPSHLYTTNGTYTVTLTTTNSFGNNSATRTDYIIVNKPAVPAVTGGARCGPGTVTLTANSTDIIRWFTSPTATVPVSTSNPYTTPAITVTTTYYVEDSVPGTSVHVGPAANTTLGTGGYFSNSTDRYLTFDVISACNLKSVVVYAQAAGSRVIEMRNSSGTALNSLTVNLTAGANTVTLNFPLTVGTGYELAINGTSNLYRNNAGGTNNFFPITASGLVSITGTNAGAGFYYYFYDWQVQGPGCVSQRAPVVATVTSGPTATLGTVNNVSCFGGTNGSAAINVSGGTPNYTYLWSNNQTTSSLTNVAQGTYTVTITDATGCPGTQSVTITQPTQLAVTTTPTNANCGQSNASIAAAVSGGTSGYTYHWSNNATTATINNIASGNYSLTVTDNNGCSVSATAAVTNAGSITLTPTSANATCFGASNGSAAIAASGGTPNYTYVWSNNQTGAQISNVASGTYTVTVSDASGCSVTESITVNQPTQITATTTVTNAACGQSNGAVALVASGGNGGYSYLWNNNATTASISNQAAGTYTVTITDNNNCTATSSAVITNNGSFTVVPTSINVLCNGGNTGSASLNVSGGTPGYTYAWSNNGSGPVITNLSAGTYTVTITDAANCNSTASVTINEPAKLTAAVNAVNPQCGGTASGSVSATATGGTSGYTYLWSNSSINSSINNVAAGNYTVTITDANSCTATAAVNLTEPSVVSVAGNSTNVLCFGTSTGTATATASGGTPGYTYTWSNSSTGAQLSNLVAGSYTVTVNDSHNCTAAIIVNVTQPSADIAASATTTDATNGLNNGTATVASVIGGTQPYTVSWSNGQSGPVATNLAPGNYTITITDANGCTKTVDVTINELASGIAQVNGGVSFNIYPNPAKDEITLMMYSSQVSTISIKNVLGQTFMQDKLQPNTQFTTIDVSNFISGVYYVEVISGGQRLVKQLVIEK